MPADPLVPNVLVWCLDDNLPPCLVIPEISSLLHLDGEEDRGRRGIPEFGELLIPRGRSMDEGPFLDVRCKEGVDHGVPLVGGEMDHALRILVEPGDAFYLMDHRHQRRTVVRMEVCLPKVGVKGEGYGRLIGREGGGDQDHRSVLLPEAQPVQKRGDVKKRGG